ncbi:MAG TPA: hypothetical protein VH186_23940 [Chloroflexia bacterium]|nr:hypothetical protein [Chloroflexia bacterium]
MLKISKSQFYELFELTDKLFRGDTRRAQRLADNLDNNLERLFFSEKVPADWFSALKVVMYAYTLYSWDCDLAWEAVNRSFIASPYARA